MERGQELPGGVESDVLEEQCTPPVDPQIHQVPGPANERTILDYLNEDCWHEVLGYLSLRETIQTERVSRRWQGVVVRFLSHVRFGIEHPFFGTKHPNNFLVPLNTAEMASSFTSWTTKLGAAVVSLHWQFEEGLDDVRENCPNLESLRLFVSPKLKQPSSANDHYNCLQKFCIYYCGDVTDACLSQFLASNALEESKILFNESITGECLLSLRSTKLKTLVFKRCKGLKFPPLLSVSDRLGALTKLVLKRVPAEIGQNAHLLLDTMPRLEYLHIQITDRGSVHMDSNVFFEAVCQLRCLEYLHVDHDAGDEHLEAVTSCCEKLRRLYLRSCREVSRRGLAAAARAAGARLAALGVRGSRRLRDDDVVACVRACPHLTSLVLDGCLELTVYELRSDLPDRVAAVRRELGVPYLLNLHLDADCWCYKHEDVLKIDTTEASYDSDWVQERG